MYNRGAEIAVFQEGNPALPSAEAFLQRPVKDFLFIGFLIRMILGMLIATQGNDGDTQIRSDTFSDQGRKMPLEYDIRLKAAELTELFGQIGHIRIMIITIETLILQVGDGQDGLLSERVVFGEDDAHRLYKEFLPFQFGIRDPGGGYGNINPPFL